MRDAHHCSGPPVSEMTYTMSSGTLNSTIHLDYIAYSEFIWSRILCSEWSIWFH